MIDLVSQIVLGLLAGWYCADVLSGVYHYGIDHFGSAETWLIGDQIGEAAIHHVRPKEFLRYSAWQSMRWPLLIGGPTCALALLPSEPLWSCFFVAGGIGITISQQVHKWCHSDRPPLLVSALQSVGVLIDGQGHMGHHSKLDRDYCVLCGWANPLMNTVLPHRKVRLAQ